MLQVSAFHTIRPLDISTMEKSDLKKMTSYVENLFDIDLGDVYRAFLEIRNRKGSRVKCLDDLRRKLIARMNEVDND